VSAAVKTGLDRVLCGESSVLRGKRIGLLCNPTAVAENLRHIADVVETTGATLVCLFGPEHGVRGDAQDMIGVGEAKDSVTGVPMHSLYGSDEASLWPKPEHVAGLDAVVYDIQDVGSRYYTYVWTLLHVMQVAAPLGVEVIVLDRPNPIGGIEVEGGAITPGCFSFVGRASIPNRHGLTAGELARYVNHSLGVGAQVTVVEMRGWRREMYFDETGLPWVQPSPNMPTLDTALVYPGMCLVEGTELSEGRGTTRPFENVGAPFISYKEAEDVAQALAREDLPGVAFRPLVFQPTFHKFGGKRCGGVALHVRERHALRPYLTAVAILRELRRRYPSQFHWRTRPYEFVANVPAIDLLCGSAEVRTGIDSGQSLGELAATWRAAERAFVSARQPWLLYP
jgi:uncharacterized protein YbbC (DUF1343 family)